MLPSSEFVVACAGLQRSNMGSFSFTLAKAVFRNWINKTIFRQEIPRAIHIEVTSKCQFNCLGCYVSPETGSIWDIERLSQLVSEAQALGIHQFTFTGGEPFLYPELILDTASRHQSSAFFVTTNGLALDDTLCSKVAKVQNLAVIVSHDGSKSHIYRNAGAGEAAQVALMKLRRLKVFTCTSTRVSKETYDDVICERYFGQLLDLGVSCAIFAPLLPGSKGMSALDDEQRSKLPELVSKLGKAVGIHAVVPCGKGEHACAGGALVAAFSSDGAALPCPHIRNYTHRWPEASLQEILESPYFKDIAKSRIPLDCGRSCLVLDHAEELDSIIGSHNA